MTTLVNPYISFPAVGGGGFEPEDTAGAVACWVADDIAQADASAVASWVDRVGGFDAAQATGAKQPVYEVAGLGGEPTVYFSGDKLLVYAAANAISTAPSGHVFIVARMAVLSTTARAPWGSMNTVGSDNIHHLYANTRSTSLRHSQQNGVETTDIITGTPGFSVDTNYLIEVSSTGSAYGQRVDNTAQSLAVTTGADNGDWFSDTANRGNFTIGGTKSTGAESFLWNGRMSAIVVVDGAISAGDRAALNAWVTDKYGITLA